VTLGLSSTVVNGWLDGTFATASCYVKLYIGDPGAAGATTPAVGDATRKQATMATASGGSKAMTGTAGPWTNVSTTETLSHIGLWSAAAAGTFNASAALTASQAWVNTNTFTLTSLSIAITPIAA
jgi:hypothetical protein